VINAGSYKPLVRIKIWYTVKPVYTEPPWD